MNKYLYIALFILFCLVISIFLNQYISQESIYENFNYYIHHLKYCKYFDSIKNDGILITINNNIKYIHSADTTNFAVNLLSYFGVFLGKSRILFINLLFYIYLLPSIYFIVFLYKKFINESKDKIADILKYIVIFLCIIFWFPTLRGLPDIAAVLPFCLLIYISMKTNFTEKISVERMISLGFICFLCLLFRRTFSTVIFAWFLSLLSYYLVITIKDLKINGTKSTLNKILFTFTNMFIMGFIFIVLFWGIASGLFWYFASGGLSKEINYYHSLPILKSIKIFYSYVNPIILILAIIPIIKASINKTYKLKPLLTVSYIFIIIYLILFLLLQDMVVENYIGIAIFINIILFASIDTICDFCKKTYIKVIFASLLTTFCVFNFYQFFFIQEGKLPYQILTHYNVSGTPLVNENKNSFYKLYDILKDKITQNPNATISSISSSALFTGEAIFYQAYVNKDIQLAKNLVRTNLINMRGLYFWGYDVDYLINVTPCTNDVNPEYWLPITLIQDDLKSETGISKSYIKIEEFKTDDNNYNITLYEKTSPVDLKDLESIIDRFLEAEPAQKKSVIKEYKKYKYERNIRNNYPDLMENNINIGYFHLF